MEARISEGQSEDIFPINAAADGIGGLAIREAFSKLEDRDQCQARWRLCGLTARREERCKLRVVVDSAETVGHLHVDVPARNAARATRWVSSGSDRWLGDVMTCGVLLP